MTRQSLITLAPDCGDPAQLCAQWNEDPELAALGRAIPAGAAAQFDLGPETALGALVIGLAANIGADMVVAGLRRLFARRVAPTPTTEEIEITVSPSPDGVLTLRVTRKRV